MTNVAYEVTTSHTKTGFVQEIVVFVIPDVFFERKTYVHGILHALDSEHTFIKTYYYI